MIIDPQWQVADAGHDVFMSSGWLCTTHGLRGAFISFSDPILVNKDNKD
jgi:hypothetical protein